MSLRVEGTQSDVQRRQEQATALQASLATAQASSLHVLHVIVQEMHKYTPPRSRLPLSWLRTPFVRGCAVYSPQQESQPQSLPAYSHICDTFDLIGQAECDALSRKHAEALGRKAALAADVAGVEGDVEALGRRKAETLTRKAALSSDLAVAEGDLEQHIASLQVRGRKHVLSCLFSRIRVFSAVVF